MGVSRLEVSKPVIAVVSGHCVAGGLELALWCDLRLCDESAVFGVFCRRVGVPLIDGGTVRLPRLIGESHAMDMILTGRPVSAQEALRMGLANRVFPDHQSLMEGAMELAKLLASFPQVCLRADRRSTRQQHGLPVPMALVQEFAGGMEVIDSGEAKEGASTFSSGRAFRHGETNRLPPLAKL